MMIPTPSMTAVQARALREESGLSQEGWARALGVAVKTVQRRESGESPINGEAAHAMLRVAQQVEDAAEINDALSQQAKWLDGQS